MAKNGGQKIREEERRLYNSLSIIADLEFGKHRLAFRLIFCPKFLPILFILDGEEREMQKKRVIGLTPPVRLEVLVDGVVSCTKKYESKEKRFWQKMVGKKSERRKGVCPTIYQSSRISSLANIGWHFVLFFAPIFLPILFVLDGEDERT